MLGKIKKVNPQVGLVDDDFYYGFSGLSEEQKFEWTSSVIRF